MKRAFKNAKKGEYEDPHHKHMAAHHKDTPWYWYIAVLVFGFVLGLVVVIKENIALPVWAYIVSLLLGIFIAPLVSILPHMSSHKNILLILLRVPSCTLGTEMALPPIIYRRCWQV